MVYVICNNTDYLEYLFGGISDEERFKIINIAVESKVLNKIFRKFLPLWLINPRLVLGKGVANQLRGLKCNDSVLIIDYSEPSLFEVIDKLSINSSGRFMWFWNPLATYNFQPYKRLQFIKERNFKIFTFDHADSENYKIGLLNQFYCMFRPHLNSRIINYDFYFLGFLKNRELKINCLRGKLSQYRIYFKLVNRSEEFIPYRKNVEMINKSRCIVEIMQDGQKGLSLRPLEAMAFRKKLLTNNLEIIDYDFYHGANIFVLGYNDLSELDEFINSPYQEISRSILEKYDVNFWLMNFELGKI